MSASGSMTWREKAFAVSLGLGVLFAVASPAFRDPPRDSFPLSDYPMFSRGRPDTGLVVVQALSVTADGVRAPLPPRVSAATYEVLQSMVVLERAVQGGRASAHAYCETTAERVRDASGELGDVALVELATSRFDVIHYFDVAPEPLAREVHARCVVPRR
jgi:hypothetical protein